VLNAYKLWHFFPVQAMLKSELPSKKLGLLLRTLAA